MRKLYVVIALLLLFTLCNAAVLINENIQSWTSRGSYGTYTQNISTGTVNMTQCIVSPTGAASGTGSKGFVQMQATSGILQLPALSSIGTATFTIRGTNRTIKLQKYNGSTWDDLTTFTVAEVAATFTYNLNSLVSSQIRLASPSGAVYVHDIIVTDYAIAAPTATSATSITSSGFIANWNSVSGAESYKLDVYTGTEILANDLFISEYIEGSSNNKVIEIFNGTGSAVNLSNYELLHFNNGSATVSYTLPLSGTLANNSVYVIANNSSNSTILALANLSTTSSVMGFNGDDAIVLNKKSPSQYVDIIGKIGEDPGTAWTSGSFSTAEKTLVRKSSVMGGITTNPSAGFPTLTTEWDWHDQDTTTYLGSHAWAGGANISYVSGYQNLDVGNVTSKQVTGLAASTAYKYRVRTYASGNTSTSSNEITVTTNATPPTITVSPSTLSDFTYIAGSGPSTPAKTFTVSGATLIGNISISAPTDYEISLNASSGYAASLNLTQTGGSVSTTTIYVRLKAGLGVGTYNETINLSSSGADAKTVTCSGATYNFPSGTPVVVGTNTITVTGGSANNGTINNPDFTNPSFTPTASFFFNLLGSGPFTIVIGTTAPYGAYYYDSSWHSVANTGSSITFANIGAKKDVGLPVVLGEQDPTLPVELSSFTATLASNNAVSIMWVTQSETNVNGYYIHRGVTKELSAAMVVSPLVPATNTSQQQVYLFTDTDIAQIGTYYYWLEAQDLDGTTVYHGPTTVYYGQGEPGAPDVPLFTELKSVYPNPFNPSTTISYSLASSATVNIVIYNSRGQIVRNFGLGTKGSGTHQLLWNGTDNSGRECSTGVYYIKMNAGQDSFIRKGVLLK